MGTPELVAKIESLPADKREDLLKLLATMTSPPVDPFMARIRERRERLKAEFGYFGTAESPGPVPRPLARALELHGDQVKQIAARNGARNLRVVGSVARGEEHEGSDIDLLVDFDSGRSLFDHARLVEELVALLGVPVDVVSERGLRPKVRERLSSEARPL